MTARVSIDGRNFVPDYWRDDTFDADLAAYALGVGELWQRVAEGRKQV
jgi:hypothetical protein